MQRGKQSWTVQNIQKMYEDKKVLSFSHPIQRAGEQWNQTQKSLLVHSILANYPIPNIYILREDSEQVDDKGKPIFNFYVLDGKQRLTNILSFIDGEYPLDDNIPNIFIEDEEYEIGGKYFCDLPELVQYELTRFKFEIVTFEDCTNDDVETIFFRLNNSTALTKSQIAKSKVGVDMAEFINMILGSRFFTESCNFSRAQLKSEDPQRVLFQSMMLMDDVHNPDFELKDFSENTILEYATSIKGAYSDEQQEIIMNTVDYLEKAFPQKDKNIRKVHIPMLVYLADIALKSDVKPMEFRQWWEYFSAEDDLMADYKMFCSSGSTRLEKITGRIVIILKSFCWYQDMDYPENMLAELEEVEAKIQEKKESEEVVSDIPEVEATDDDNSTIDTEEVDSEPEDNMEDEASGDDVTDTISDEYIASESNESEASRRNTSTTCSTRRIITAPEVQKIIMNLSLEKTGNSTLT